MKDLRDNWPYLLALLVMIGVSVFAWPRVPETLAVHWGVDGNPDRYAGRLQALWLLPSIGVAMLAAALLAGRGAADGNAKIRSTTFKAVLLGFAVLHLGIVASYLGAELAIPRIAGAVAGGILLFTGNLLPKAQPNRWVGIRTPWTLRSRRAWNKTHRLGGRLLFFAGLAFIVTAAVTPSPVALFLVVGVTVLGMLALVAYSYVVWRADDQRGGSLA